MGSTQAGAHGSADSCCRTSCCCCMTAAARANFVEFESGQVRPLAMSPDGTQAVRRQHPGQPARRSSASTRTAA